MSDPNEDDDRKLDEDPTYDPKETELKDKQWSWWFYGPGTQDEV